MELKKPQRLAAIKKWGEGWERAHLETRRGTRDEARDYCMKNETAIDGPWEHGDFGKGQGNRSDIDTSIKILTETRSLKRVAEEQPATFMRMHKGFRAWLDITENKKRDWPMKVIVFWGEPGSGKSRKAREIDENAFNLQEGNNNTV